MRFSVIRSYDSTMIITIARLLVIMVVQGGECLGLPNHCFCYKWRGLVRTDCVRKNLFNTFVGFSHQTQVLDLSHNVISILHGNEFLDANLFQLQDLRLSNNRLVKIDKLSFNGLQFLENVDLSFNFIEYLNPSTFKYNPYLRTLNVSFNPLSLKKDEPFLSPGSSLQVLDMTNCQLELLSPHTFMDFKRLRELNISRNYIRKIEIEDFNEMISLRFLDLSKNDLPCNDETKAFLQFFETRNIQIETLCQTNQKILMSSILEGKETKRLEMEVNQGDYNESTTESVAHQSIYNEVIQFFQLIPSFYAIVCALQLGIFIGSLSTYCCLRKSVRNQRRNAYQNEVAEERTRYANGQTHSQCFTPIPLNTPPGTPPSPYYSRFFPSSFSLSAT